MFYLSQDLISKLIWNEYGQGVGELSKVSAKTNYTLILKAENLLKSIKFSTITLSYFSIFFRQKFNQIMYKNASINKLTKATEFHPFN